MESAEEALRREGASWNPPELTWNPPELTWNPPELTWITLPSLTKQVLFMVELNTHLVKELKQEPGEGGALHTPAVPQQHMSFFVGLRSREGVRRQSPVRVPNQDAGLQVLLRQ